MRYTFLPLLAGAVLAASACSDHQSPLAPPARPSLSSGHVTPFGPWAKIDTGDIGPGSKYALYIPENWNGDAIYYAHGIRPPLDPITLDDQDNFFEVRDALGELGYAFAYSSFSQNGLAVKQGAQDTHQLRGLLMAQLHATPAHSYLAGYSLGALAALDLAEQYPDQYSGLLAMCGMVGGSMTELQYVGDVRVLFDYFYPGVLPGNVITPPETPLTQNEVAGLVIAAISANPLGMYAIASTAQTPLAYPPGGNLMNPADPTFQALVQSLIAALYYDVIGSPDLLGRTHGHSPYANRGRVYSVGTLAIPQQPYATILTNMIAAANAGVARYDMPPDATNYLSKYYTPTGNLQFPVVTVHNAWDYLVPVFNEAVFAGIVDGAGKSDMLLQRTVYNYGHCQFDTPLVVSSFQTLVDWVTTGIKPAS